MERKFQKKIEDFLCEHCGNFVKGSGYTNHCPKCLWSKHVDINPGDRAEKCGGLMEPVAVEKGSEGYDIIHKCIVCGKKQRTKSNKSDDFDILVEIAKKSAESRKN